MPDEERQSLSYKIIGKGDAVCIAFHGFGQNPDVMKYLSEPPEFEFKVVAVALHYHGTSSSPEPNEALNVSELEAAIHKITNELGIERFHIAGFSIGARLALSLLPAFAHRLDGVWLFAPDGLPVSNAYRFATGNKLGIAMLKWLMHYAILFRILLWGGAAMKLIEKKTAAYFLNELKTKTLRQRIVNTWLLYRNLIPDMAVIAEVQMKFQLSLTLISGKFDKVIIGTRCAKYLVKYHINFRHIEISHGHNLMSTKAFRKIGDLINERVEVY
jgi:pimeloyl-ACP methyl ester carboxylesterase